MATDLTGHNLLPNLLCVAELMEQRAALRVAKLTVSFNMGLIR